MQITPCAGRKPKQFFHAVYLTASRIAKGERGIWQRRYWEHTLRNDDNLRRRHVHYIHYPKNGHVRYATRLGSLPAVPEYGQFAQREMH